jgi:hypothetical protein
MEVALSNNGSDETRYHYLKGEFPEQRPQRYKKVLHSEVSPDMTATEEGSLSLTAAEDSRDPAS